MTVQEKTLHIDIPVKLTEVKVVFSVASLSFEGDLPASLFHLQLIVNDISNWKAKSQVVAVFHTNAGHVTLHARLHSRPQLYVFVQRIWLRRTLFSSRNRAAGEGDPQSGVQKEPLPRIACLSSNRMGCASTDSACYASAARASGIGMGTRKLLAST